MITIATCFWTANAKSAEASRCYSAEWVNRLYRGFARNLTVPFRFVVLKDKPYQFAEGIEQERLGTPEPGWESMIEPFRLQGPSIIVGLDTIITGNCDALADYCMTADRIALPRSPGKDYACNGVALVPKGWTRIHSQWRGENDMEWLRTFPHTLIETFAPGQVESFKCGVRARGGLADERLVYFHGHPKPSDCHQLPWVRKHWS